MYQIFEVSSDAPLLFRVDCEDSEQFDTTVEWTDKPVESGADQSRFGVTKPDTINITGTVTASPFGEAMNDGRVSDAITALKAIARKKQPVTVVAGYQSAEMVLTHVGATAGIGQGKQATVMIDAKEVATVQPEIVDMPAARLAPSVRKRASKAKRGGAKTGVSPDDAVGLELQRALTAQLQ